MDSLNNRPNEITANEIFTVFLPPAKCARCACALEKAFACVTQRLRQLGGAMPLFCESCCNNISALIDQGKLCFHAQPPGVCNHNSCIGATT